MKSRFIFILSMIIGLVLLYSVQALPNPILEYNPSLNSSQYNILDQSGNGYTGTYQGYTYYDGTINGNVVVDNGTATITGLSGQNYIATTSTFTNNQSYTVSCWFKPTQMGNTHLNIFGIQNNYDGFGLDFNSNEDVSAYVRSSSGSLNSPWVALDLNKWYHLVGIYDYPNQTIKLYVNGEYTGEQSAYTNWNPAPIRIGGIFAGNADTADFEIKQARVWNRVLSESEIQAEMNSIEPVNPDGLLLSYDFYHYNSTSVLDSKNLGQGFNQSTYSVNFIGNQSILSPVAWDFHNELIGSYSLWFKDDSNHQVNQVLYYPSNKLEFYLASDGKLYVLFYDANSNFHSIQVGSNTYYDNKWHYATVSKNSTSINIYIDSIFKTSFSTSLTTQSQDSYMYYGSKENNDYYYYGQLSDVRLYNTSLTSHDIFTMYQNTSIFAPTLTYDNPVDIIYFINSPFNYTFDSHIHLVRTDNNQVMSDYSTTSTSNVFHTLSFNYLPAGHYNLSINNSYGTEPGDWMFKSVAFSVDRELKVNVQTPDNQTTSTSLKIASDQGNYSFTDSTGTYSIDLLSYLNLALATQYNFTLTKDNYKTVNWSYNNTIYQNVTFSKTIYPYEWFYVFDAFDNTPINMFNISFTHNNIPYLSESTNTGYVRLCLDNFVYGTNIINISSYLFNNNVSTMDIEPSSVFNKTFLLDEKRVMVEVHNELDNSYIYNYTMSFDNGSKVYYFPHWAKLLKYYPNNWTSSPYNAFDMNPNTFARQAGNIAWKNITGEVSFVNTTHLPLSSLPFEIKFSQEQTGSSTTNWFYLKAYNPLTNAWDTIHLWQDTDVTTPIIYDFNLDPKYLVNDSVKFEFYWNNAQYGTSLWYIMPQYAISQQNRISYFILPKNLNTITVNSNNYISRHYLLTPDNNYNLVTYLLPNGQGQYYSIYVYNAGGTPIHNAEVIIQHLMNGKWVSLSQELTDASGKSSFYLSLTNPSYRMIVEADGYVSLSTDLNLDPSNLLTQVILQTTGENGANQVNFITPFTNISYNYAPNSTSNTSLNFTFSIYSSNNDLGYYGFRVYNITSGYHKLITNIEELNSPSGGVLSWYTNETGSYEIRPYFLKGNNTETELHSIDYIVYRNGGLSSIDLSASIPPNVWWIIIIVIELVTLIFIGRFTVIGAGFAGLVVMAFMIMIYPAPLAGIPAWTILIITGILLFSLGVVKQSM